MLGTTEGSKEDPRGESMEQVEKNAWVEGFKQGYVEGFRHGYNKEYKDGYSTGYNAGYAQALAECVKVGGISLEEAAKKVRWDPALFASEFGLNS